MFTVPQNIRKYKLNTRKDARNALVVKLKKEGLTNVEIAHHPEIIELSDGYTISRERVRKILSVEEQKTA